MYFVYIIEGCNNGRWYIGSTQDVANRLIQHNAGRVQSTKPYRPYTLIYQERHENRRSAELRERQIKRSGFIRQAIRCQIKNNGPIV